MKPWDQRPLEIRNLFNPAFCGLVLFRAFGGFEEQDERGMPFSLALLILPLCLHKETREIIADGNRSYLLKTLTSNPQVLVGFARRTTDLLPITFEALGVLMSCGAFEVTAEGNLKLVPNKVRKTISGTRETMACQRVARYVGKEFATIGDRVTVYTALGVKP